MKKKEKTETEMKKRRQFSKLVLYILTLCILMLENSRLLKVGITFFGTDLEFQTE